MLRLKRKLRSHVKHRDFFVVLVLMIFTIYLILDLTLLSCTPKTRSIMIGGHIGRDERDSACLRHENIVFIKQMKCATSTIVGIMYRFGYKRNLSFVSPLKKKLYLNWPYRLTMRDFRPSSSGYNILTDHSIYTQTIMEKIMPKNAVYISMIRQPLAHAKSVFQYFKLNIIAGIPDSVDNIFITYFDNVSKNEAAYTRPNAKGRSCVPNGFSLTKNVMSHCLGMPLGFPPGTLDISDDSKKVDEYFHHIKRKFKLIMLVEYFFESLILLRRFLCWEFNDIIFMKSNIAKYSFDTQQIPSHIVDIHKNWTSIDYKLYEFFNQTFWEHVSDQGDGFFEEASAFKTVEDKVQIYCRSLYKLGERPAYRYPKGKQELIIQSSRWSPEFKVTPEDCWMLGPNPYKLMKTVQAENDIKEAVKLREQEQIHDERKLIGLC